MIKLNKVKVNGYDHETIYLQKSAIDLILPQNNTIITRSNMKIQISEKDLKKLVKINDWKNGSESENTIGNSMLGKE